MNNKDKNQSQFAVYSFKEELLQAIEQLGFKKPTQVQARVFSSALRKENVIGMSETGSGKSHAFLLPIFNNLDFDLLKIQSVIVTPSRELAEQLYQMAQEINELLPKSAKISLVIGGKDRDRLKKSLDYGTSQIIIGTPGRISEFINELKHFYADFVTAVIDEADMALDLGNADNLNTFLNSLPEKHQIMFFSATINKTLQMMIKKFLHGEVQLKEVPNLKIINEKVTNYLISTKSLSNEEVIYRLITRKPEFLVLIFANTKKRVEEIYHYLSDKGLNVAQLHGNLPSRRRRQIMKRIVALDYNFVVSTDLAARGIDIPGVSLVVNDDIPSDLSYFIHRVGRTARNGQSGVAITLYHLDERRVKELEDKGIKFQEVRLTKGQLVKIKGRKQRQLRNRMINKSHESTVPISNKMKKVKPGYKRRIRRMQKGR